MKTFRKNIDLDSRTVAILQIEGSLKGYGTLKPFIESIVREYAAKAIKSRPGVYNALIGEKNKIKKSSAITRLKNK